MLVSPEIWRQFYKPIYRRYFELIHDSGAKTWLHCDGAVWPIIPDLIEIGLDILDPVQAECMDPGKLREVAGDKLVIWGGLGSQIVSTGEYESVRSHVGEMIEACDGFQGGMVGSASNLLIFSPDTPLAIYHGLRNSDSVPPDP